MSEMVMSMRALTQAKCKAGPGAEVPEEQSIGDSVSH